MAPTASYDDPPPVRTGLSFHDANIALLARESYFFVHQGVLMRHSKVLADAISDLGLCGPSTVLKGNPLLKLDDDPTELHWFLLALYDGISTLNYNCADFPVVSALLRLSTKYEVDRIRGDLIQGLAQIWPKFLSQWEAREANATNTDGSYLPRQCYPHPIQVINLAQSTNTLALLPAAFYDLCRYPPSEAVAGLIASPSSEPEYLTDEDLMRLLRGKEHASRFLSTFIVNHLEGREPSLHCIYRRDNSPARRRHCQAAFEAMTFEILRNLNGVICHRTLDPLAAILDIDLTQLRTNTTVQPTSGYCVCDRCRLAYEEVVEQAREELWRKLPVWFDIDIHCWD
ncbi:hypothetical protein BDN72DRAFT_123245 [Pluteus cervinus]|uniref:Uncharacterized protein n=1 Tax=Pluteus cervinus TaxID=181527 RepID=A0ACD3B7T7_9AGAR|nr:hypothetical protein BDN72DRAFT_123245 [Pluteus cervinus]